MTALPPTSPEVQASREESVARVLGGLYHLALQAIRADSRQAAVFRILNDTIRLAPYERAALFDITHKPRLQGVSGQVEIDPRGELADAWARLIRAIPDTAQSQRLRKPSEAALVQAWREVCGDADRAVLWLPLPTKTGPCGLWLERDARTPWSDDESALLQSLAEGYALALERHAGQARRWRQRLGSRAGLLFTLVLLLAGYGLFVHPMPIRVVAPCEVVPDEPVSVTAPLTGVVERLLVAPGDTVAAGQELFRYDPHLPQQELEIARQQVEVIRSRLERATVLSLTEPEAVDELAVLRRRLAQEEATLALAQYRVERLIVRAPQAGVVRIDSPHAWEGRAVRLGEAVLTLVDPSRSRVRLWIAESDKVPDLEQHPVEVVLHVEPGRSRAGEIVFLSESAGLSPAGVPGFLAEAHWTEPDAPPALGLQGTAVLRGEDATLAYGLLRKPWSALRRRIGW